MMRNAAFTGLTSYHELNINFHHITLAFNFSDKEAIKNCK